MLRPDYPADARLVLLDLARMEPGADLDAEPANRVADRAGAPDRTRGAVEGGQEAVAGDPDLLATEPLKPVSDKRVVLAQESSPAPVAELGGTLGRADDVREEHGREHAVRLPAAS